MVELYGGKRIGLLTVIGIDTAKTTPKQKFWLCKCDCGKVVSVRRERFKTQRSCGCIRANSLNAIGKTFGRLTVIEPDIKLTNERKSGIYFKCLCECGNEHTVLLGSLTAGQVKSCGCLVKENIREVATTHGKSKTRLYGIWHSMKSRCLNKTAANYNRYGGNGVTICEEWANDYMTFHNWSMSNGYAEGLTLDRVNNDKGYNPDNCRWVTYTEQENNKSSCKPVIVNNKYYTSINALARECNISSVTLGKHLKKGDLEEYVNKRINKEKEPK